MRPLQEAAAGRPDASIIAARKALGNRPGEAEYVRRGDPIILTPATPDRPIPWGNPVVQAVNTVWDARQFAVPRAPVIVGEVADREGFSHPQEGVEYTLYMPIKLPGTEYRLPPELGQFTDPLQTMIGFENAINPDVAETYAYLTVDFGEVKAGQGQRKGGAHTDGFQGAPDKPKHKINHFYAVSSALPTLHHPQAFDITHLDPAVDNVFHAMEAQVDPNLTGALNPFEIALLDAYTVHEVATATEDTWRVFTRLTYDYEPYTRSGSTHNPYFDYDWGMVARTKF